MSELAGYRGRALDFLKKYGVAVGDIVEVATDWGTVTGTLVPRYLYDDDMHIVLKLSSGYNVGLSVSRLRGLKLKAKGEKPSFRPPPAPRSGEQLPRVSIIGTGGTIASRVDYRTGAVHPAISAEELYALIPELSGIAKIEPEILMSIYSENMEPSHWQQLAERVRSVVLEGAAGVVITHGTDTMGYTAAALSFALTNVPVPVILVGAQRSSDRPSSDAFLNLVGAVHMAANGGFSGVYVAMHLDDSDGSVALHRGTRVRKNHTSARSAFESVGVPLAAIWRADGFQYLDPSLPKRSSALGWRPQTKFDGRVALFKFYPSMPGSIVRALSEAGIKVIVVEGTGLGHVSSSVLSALRDFISGGGVVFMTSQCINGRVDLNVYDTGRDLLKAGVIPLEDMLPETALAKAMWALANSSSVEEMKLRMVNSILGEITARSFPKR
jgi:glutamyl-tRNA(Gln) amidotransferase subunit D